MGFVRVLNIKKKTRKTRGKLIPPGGAYNRIHLIRSLETRQLRNSRAIYTEIVHK